MAIDRIDVVIGLELAESLKNGPKVVAASLEEISKRANDLRADLEAVERAAKVAGKGIAEAVEVDAQEAQGS